MLCFDLDSIAPSCICKKIKLHRILHHVSLRFFSRFIHVAVFMSKPLLCTTFAQTFETHFAPHFEIHFGASFHNTSHTNFCITICTTLFPPPALDSGTSLHPPLHTIFGIDIFVHD
jgi:hypothetical protein